MTDSKRLPVLILACASLFFAYDIVSDLLDDDENALHIIIEALVFIAITAVLYREILRLRSLHSALAGERDRSERLSGELMATMRRQFEQWQLSPSETEVALLLIKGLSMKEIAEARKVKEKTVRTQAANVYAKSGYAGRHELAAHFIEDLMTAPRA